MFLNRRILWYFRVFYAKKWQQMRIFPKKKIFIDRICFVEICSCFFPYVGVHKILFGFYYTIEHTVACLVVINGLVAMEWIFSKFSLFVPPYILPYTIYATYYAPSLCACQLKRMCYKHTKFSSARTIISELIYHRTLSFRFLKYFDIINVWVLDQKE